jgi:hypothetical protein
MSDIIKFPTGPVITKDRMECMLARIHEWEDRVELYRKTLRVIEAMKLEQRMQKRDLEVAIRKELPIYEEAVARMDALWRDAGFDEP